jgi:hypothetical protein
VAARKHEHSVEGELRIAAPAQIAV